MLWSLLFLFCQTLFATLDPLPSWNEGAAKKGIIRFVQAVTEKGGKNYVAPENRIVVFDNDGTLWVEKPFHVECLFIVDRMKSLAGKHPEWKNQEPFKSILEQGTKALDELHTKDLEKLIAVTHTGMTLGEFHKMVSVWLENTEHPTFHKKFTELVYQPMLEVINLLRDHQFAVYIVSGGGQEFIRSFAEKLYGIRNDHIIGTASKMDYEYRKGHPVLRPNAEVLFVDDQEKKPMAINLIIGKRPIAAFGNSIGDQQMLEWTTGQKGKHFEALVHHDDAEREYAYGPNSKTGTFSEALMKEAKKEGWMIISMKKDWKILFPWQMGLPSP